MWIATEIRPAVRKTRQTSWHRRIVIQCDRCAMWSSKKFDRSSLRGKLSFCSAHCRSEITKTLPWSDVRRAKASARAKITNAKRWLNADAHRKQSEAVKKTHLDPVLKTRRAASIRAAKGTSESRARQSITAKLNVARVQLTNRVSGNCRESKGEREMVSALRLEFGEDDVVHHPPNHVRGASIDAYVRSIDCYIQFDGVYYHGLDRPYDQLSPMIRRKYDRDRSVERLFFELGLRLVRITDKRWMSMSSSERQTWTARLRLPTE